MFWRFWPKRNDPTKTQPNRSKKRTERELRAAAAAPDAKRDRQPRNKEQVKRDPETDPAKPSDN